MYTTALVQALVGVEEAPWKDANNGREIDDYWLREKLKGFLPRPANPEAAAELRRSREWREGKGPARKGYTEAHLQGGLVALPRPKDADRNSQRGSFVIVQIPAGRRKWDRRREGNEVQE